MMAAPAQEGGEDEDEEERLTVLLDESGAPSCHIVKRQLDLSNVQGIIPDHDDQ